MAGVKLDSTDARILLALDDDPGATVVALATRLNLARNTVHARLRRMEEGGALAAPSRRVEPAAMGYSLLAFVELSLSQTRTGEVETALARVPEVLEVIATSGDSDMIARVVAQDTADLYRITKEILQLPGVLRSNTSIALGEVVPLRTRGLLERRARG